MIKEIKTDKYAIVFNTENGMEISGGINGYADPFVLDYPSLMDIGIMGHCKNNCEICYQGNTDKPNMKLEDFKRIIDESKDYITQVALGGKGDPNLHENFKEILEYCKLNNVVPNYTTSGNGLTEEHIKITKKYCGAVAVSAYNKDFTFKALNMFINSGVKTNIHYVLSKTSMIRAINILGGIDVWNKQFNIDKLNAIIFLLFKPQGNGANHRDLQVTDRGIKLFREELKRYKTHFKVGLDSCLVCRISEVCHDFTQEELECLDTCEGARMSCYITPDMKFMPCSFANHDEIGVPINGYPIKYIWENSNVFNYFRDKLKENPNKCPLEFK